MKGFLNYDGYLTRILTKVMYVVSLNLLFLICSVPIFTIGAASTAMYTVLLHFLQGDEPNILKGFLRAFRDNFKKSTVIWLIMLALGGTLALNYYVLYHLQIPGAGAIRILLNLILVALVVL